MRIATADNGRPAVFAEVPADRERTAWRRGKDSEEFSGSHASTQAVVEFVVEQVVAGVASNRVVVDTDRLTAVLGEEGGEPVGSTIGAREQDEDRGRSAR